MFFVRELIKKLTKILQQIRVEPYKVIVSALNKRFRVVRPVHLDYVFIICFVGAEFQLSKTIDEPI